MVVIRLARGGAKKQPFYHVVVADQRDARDGHHLERVGYFNPVARGQAVRIDLNVERIQHWVKLGAQPSERVARLMKDFAAGKTSAKPRRQHQPAPAKAAAPAPEAASTDAASE